MKKLGVLLFALSLAAGALAQDQTEGKPSFFSQLTTRMAEKNILNHMDVGVNVGTVGLGIEVAAPIGDYVRVRAGYNWIPSFNFHSDFNVDTSTGGGASSFISKFGKINEKLTQSNIDINLPYFAEEKELMEQFANGNIEAKDYVSMRMKPNVHQFKFLVDVMPFKNNKHWSFTAGFFVGPSNVGHACNAKEETPILKAVNLYNSRYYRDYILPDDNGLYEMYFQYVDGDGNLHYAEINSLTDFVKKTGMAGFSLGTFKDDGLKALMLPDKDAKARAEMKVSKFRPYLGFGYNTHLSKDKRWNLNVDAGILILCGAPSVYVDNVYKIDASPLQLDENGNYLSGMGLDEYGNYYGDIVRWNPEEWTYEPVNADKQLDHVDLVRDLKDIPGKAGSMVNTISKFKVYPNASVTFSYKLF